MKHINLFTIKPILNTRITKIALLSLLALATLGVNEAWAKWPEYSGSCSTSGYVLVADGETYSAALSYNEEYNLAGPGATLTFKAHKTVASVGSSIKVYQYVDGAYQEDAIFSKNDPGKVTKKNVLGIPKEYGYEDNAFSCTLSPKATKIKFVFAGSLNKYIKEVRVTRYSSNDYLLYDDNLDCGSADYNYAQSSSNYTTGTANVDWSHTTTQPTCTITGTYAKYFEIGTKSNTPANNKYGAMSIVIKYKHTAPGDHSATLKVGSKTITIKGHTNKIPTYITTVPTMEPITYGEKLSNSQIGADGVVKADVINAAGTVVAGTWSIDEAGQTVTVSGGTYKEVHLTFTPTDQSTYQTVTTTANVFVRSASTISWTSAYSADKPTIAVGKEIVGAAISTNPEATITYSTSNPSVIAVSEDKTTFTAVAEGEATITASHGATTHYGAASASKTFKTSVKTIQVIVWNQRFNRLTTEDASVNLNAQVYLESPSTGARTYSAERTALLTYSSLNSNVVAISGTTLTINGKGSTTLTASVSGSETYEEASVTMPVKVRIPSEGCETELLADLENDGSHDYLYELYKLDAAKPELISSEYTIDRSNGKKPGSLSFEHKGEYYKVLGFMGNWYSGNIHAEQKVNGSWSTIPGSDILPTISQWKTCEDLILNENATHIRFIRPQGGEGHHYIRNVQVTKKQYLNSSTTSVDFGSSIKVNDAEYRDITINYSDVKDVLRITSPGNDFTIADQVDVECGDNGSATLRLAFNPKSAGEFNGNVIIRDNIANLNCTISVHANVQKAEQIITWNPTTSLLATETLSLNGTTNGTENGKQNSITYTSDDNSVVTISNGTATILKPGTVKITATQDGTANFAAATPVEKEFTISAETLSLTAPTASAITYENSLDDSELSGGFAKDSKDNIVQGTFSWQAGGATPDAGDAQEFTVVFTPAANAAWYESASINVPINVAKATSVAVPSAEAIDYGYAVNASTLSNSGTAGTWTWTDERKNDILNAGEYTDLAVHFTPANSNYTELDGMVTLIVNAISPELTWTTAVSSIAVDAQNITFAAASEQSAGAINYSITSGESFATIDSNTGALTILGAGEITVRASIAETGNYTAEYIEKNVRINALNEFVNAKGDKNWNDAENWSNGEVPAADVHVTISADVEIAEAIIVDGITINAGSTITIMDGATLTVGGEDSKSRTTYGNIIVEAGGQLNLTTGAVKVNDFTLYSGFEGGQPKSGQVDNAGALTALGNAYFIIDIDATGAMVVNDWYDLTVPFQVDARTGITRYENGDWQPLTYNTHYAFMDYHEDVRARGQNGWKWYSGTLQPGVMYSFISNATTNRYRFARAENSTFNTALSYQLQASESDDNTLRGWNGLGNGTLTYVTIDGAPVVQMLDHVNDVYQSVNSASHTFAVGAAYFYQAANTGDELSMSAANGGSNILRAPERNNAADASQRFGLTLAADGRNIDNLFITCSDDATDTYTIGKDVAKMGATTGAKIARLWTNAKGTSLCAVDAAYNDDQAIIPLQIYTPAEATYTLALDSERDEQILLTRNGVVVWDLTISGYTFDLNAGTDDTYALQVVRRVQNVVTGINAINNNGTEFVEKMIVNGQLFLLRDGILYDAQGRKVENR